MPRSHGLFHNFDRVGRDLTPPSQMVSFIPQSDKKYAPHPIMLADPMHAIQGGSCAAMRLRQEVLRHAGTVRAHLQLDR